MTTKTQALNQTVDVKTLTLQDWLNICNSIGNNPMWAFYKWVEITSFDLSELSLKDWEEIAEACDSDDRWAYYRFKEYSA